VKESEELALLRKKLAEQAELIEKLSFDLTERNKELWCQNEITRLLNDPGLSTEEILTSLPLIITKSFQHPELTSCCIKVQENEHRSEPFFTSDYFLKSAISVREKQIGTIEIFFNYQGGTAINDPFLKEEYEMMTVIAQRIAAYIDLTLKTNENIETASRYRNLLESIEEIVFESDISGKIRFISPKLVTISGYHPDDIKDKFLTDFIHPDDLNYLEQFKNELYEHYRAISEFRLATKAGKYQWVRISASLSGTTPENALIAGTITDIDSIKKTESELKDRELLNQSILEASPDVITITDLFGNIQYASPKVVKMFGGTDSKEFNNRSLMEFIDASDHEKAIKGIEQMFAGNFGAAEYSGKRNDGTLFDIEVNGDFVRDSNGQPKQMIFITRDISYRKKTEAELSETNRKINVLMNNLKGVAYRCNNDEQWTMDFISDGISELSGYPADDFRGNKIRDYNSLIHPDDRQMVWDIIQENLNRRVPYTLEYRILTSENVQKWVWERGQGIFIDNELIALEGFISDITDKKLADEALLENEQKYRLIAENTSDGILVLNAAGEMTYGSPAYLKQMGYQPDEKVLLNAELIYKNIHPDDRDDLFRLIYDAISKKTSDLSYAYRALHQNGQYYWFEDKVNFIYDAQGNHLYSNIISRNIDERKKTEETNRKLSQAIEQSPVSIVITNLDGNIEYANPKACESTGYSLDELIGKNPRVLKSGETRMEEYTYLWNNISTGKEWKGIFHNKRKNGELYWESSTIAPVLDSDGNITHYIAVKEDITERIKAEEDLRKFRIISEQANYGIAIADLTGVLLYTNRSFAGMHGYEPEEITGRHLSMLHTKEQMVKVIETIDALKRSGGFTAEEVWRVRKDGSVFPSLMSGVTIYDKDNHPQFIAATTLDITELKKAENSLRISEEQLNYAQEIANMGSWEFDIPTQTITWSRNYYRIIGMDPASPPLSLEQIKLMVHPDDRNLLENKLESLTKNSNLGSFSFRMFLPDGAMKWFQANLVGKFENDQLVHISGVSIDITEKKLYEEKLYQQNLRLNAIMDAMPDNIFISDIEGNYLEYFKSKTNTLLGDYEHLVGQNVKDAFDAEVAELHLKKFRECIETQKIVAYEYYKYEDGIQKYFEGRLVPMDETKLLRFVRDITEKKTRERELKKLNLAIEQSPVAIVITDLEANVEYVSPSFYHTTGYTAEEVIGKNTRFLKSGLTPPEVYEELWNTLWAGKPWQYEWVNKKKSGELYWENISITPIQDENGIITNYLAIKQDISERKNAEKEILDLNQNLEKRIAERTKDLENSNIELEKARIEADKANMAKSEFLSRMSHELRTPMNSILGYAQLLEMGDLNIPQQKGVKHIIKSGKHLLSLINEVLDIARIESGRMSLSLEPVGIEGLIHEIVDIVHPLAENKQILIKSCDLKAAEMYVLSDRQRLKQVLINIINNAVKYNVEYGTVGIQVKSSLAETDSAQKVIISVSDTGPGISPDDITKIFTPFERIGAEKTTTEGTGLGLAVVKKLIDIMGGKVGVESELEKGSTFWIELPRVDSPVIQAEKSFGISEPVSETNGKKGRILYIEDNISNIELIEQIIGIQRPEIELTIEMLGTNAVTRAVEIKPDLILLDLNLPDIHGAEVLERLLDHHETASVPVIIISADAMPHQLMKMIKAGAKNYLTKPLNIVEFIRIVDEYIK